MGIKISFGSFLLITDNESFNAEKLQSIENHPDASYPFLHQDTSLILELLLPSVLLLVHILKRDISTHDSRRELYILHENEKILSSFSFDRIILKWKNAKKMRDERIAVHENHFHNAITSY